MLAGSRPDYAAAGRDLGEVSPSRTLSVRLYLGARDPGALDSFLRSVTDPKSRSYQHFLTPAEYRRRFAPTPAQRRAVTHWLSAAGLRVTVETLHYVQVSGPERGRCRGAGYQHPPVQHRLGALATGPTRDRRCARSQQ